jgi:hypothetical protein
MATIQQANHTDLTTTETGEFSVTLLWIEGVAWSTQRIPTAVNIGFLDRNITHLSEQKVQVSQYLNAY